MTDLALPVATDITVYATNPREMAQAQAGMVGWCQGKIDQAARQRHDGEPQRLSHQHLGETSCP